MVGVVEISPSYTGVLMANGSDGNYGAGSSRSNLIDDIHFVLSQAPPELQALLAAASVLGHSFTPEAIVFVASHAVRIAQKKGDGAGRD